MPLLRTCKAAFSSHSPQEACWKSLRSLLSLLQAVATWFRSTRRTCFLGVVRGGRSSASPEGTERRALQRNDPGWDRSARGSFGKWSPGLLQALEGSVLLRGFRSPK